jgi:lysophospholipid acyltransferase (LPLAT)-like uncharacterized protein
MSAPGDQGARSDAPSSGTGATPSPAGESRAEAKPKAADASREGAGFRAFAAFRRVRDATRAVRRPLKPALNRVLLPIGSLFVTLWIAGTNRTVRFEIVGPRHDEPLLAAGEPVVYAFFHSRLFGMFRMLRGRQVAVLVALGDIGDVISSVARRLGHIPVRGSRSGRAARALAELIHEVRRGRSAAFAVDGPRGPREIVKPGALFVAQKSGYALVPIATASRRKWNLGIWDRHEVPLPFTKTIALMAEPVRVARHATREEVEAATRKLQATLVALGQQAADKVRRYDV